MENRNCKKCGKVFRYISGYPLCKECKELDEEQYKMVREYIKEHPGTNIEQVASALNISHQQILRYLREERLEISQRSDKFILCELCGSIIKTGRFCESCKREINKELNKEYSNKLDNVYYYNEEEEKRIRQLGSKRKDI